MNLTFHSLLKWKITNSPHFTYTMYTSEVVISLQTVGRMCICELGSERDTVHLAKMYKFCIDEVLHHAVSYAEWFSQN